MKTLHFRIAYRTKGVKAGRAGGIRSGQGRRARVASAGEHIRYITRAVADAGEHAGYVTRTTHRTREDLVTTGHGNLPAWAGNDPIQFFEQSAIWERAGGRTVTQITTQLPRELTPAQQQEAVETFVRSQLGTQHAYVWGIHEVQARDGGQQPHVHLAFCERTDTGGGLSPTMYFSRQGYQKDRTFNDQGWPGAARQAWADTLNITLEHAGIATRVDARTFRAQGVVVEATPRLSLDAVKYNPALLDARPQQPDTPEMQASRAAAWEARKQALGLTPTMTHDAIVQRIGDASREAIAAHQTHRRQVALELGSDPTAVARHLAVTEEKQATAQRLTRDEERYMQHPEQARTMAHLTAVTKLVQSAEEDTPQRRVRRRLGRDMDEEEQGHRRGYGLSR